MKLYTLMNNKTGQKNEYSWLAWNIAWLISFLFGVITGACLF